MKGDQNSQEVSGAKLKSKKNIFGMVLWEWKTILFGILVVENMHFESN